MTDHRLRAPAALRNRDPILAVLRDILPETGTVLEIASGSGQHVVHFAEHLPDLVFRPSDPGAEALLSIAGWVEGSGLGNIRAPVPLDVADLPWPVSTADAVLCINMIHISPWEATGCLMRGAAAILPPGAPLYLYGPYRLDGGHTAASNAAFDEDLRRRDPSWGVRDLETVTAQAQAAGFTGPDVTAMPANNLSVVFRRR